MPPSGTARQTMRSSRLRDAGDFGNEPIAMLGDRFDIAPLAASVAKGTPNGVDHLADVPLFDDDTWPHRRQDRFLRDERAAVSHEMNECPERLFRDDDAFASLTALERALANIELELAELVDLDNAGQARRKAAEQKRNEEFTESE